jgi:hypothetical protein
MFLLFRIFYKQYKIVTLYCGYGYIETATNYN